MFSCIFGHATVRWVPWYFLSDTVSVTLHTTFLLCWGGCIIIKHFVLSSSLFLATAHPCFIKLPLSGWWCRCCMWICVIGEQRLIDWVKNTSRGVSVCVWVNKGQRLCWDAGARLRNLREEPYVKRVYF